jgi:hypothetical protein
MISKKAEGSMDGIYVSTAGSSPLIVTDGQLSHTAVST